MLKGNIIKTAIAVAFILLCHLALLVLTKFTLWPEMVVYPYLVNNNFNLYTDVINPYPPIITVFLSAVTQFLGYQPIIFQMLTWVLVPLIDITVFSISLKINNIRKAAILSTIAFSILSIPFGINGLWFDLFQVPFILLSFYWLYRFLSDRKQKSLMVSVVFLTIAFFIKQQAAWIIVWFFAVAVFYRRFNILQYTKKLHILVGPFIILLTLCLIYAILNNSAKDFIYWVFYFPFFKASSAPGYVQFPTIRQLLIVASVFLLYLPLLSNKAFPSRLIFLTALVLLLFSYPRFDYFHLIASFAILSIGTLKVVNDFKNMQVVDRAILVISIIFLSVFAIRYFVTNSFREIRFFEPNTVQTSKLLSRLRKAGPIYIQNGPDQLFPLSNTIPPKPWADEFPWYLENNDLQDKIIDGLKQEKPSFIVYKPYDNNGHNEIGSYKPQKIVEYIDTNYKNLYQLSDTLWLKVRK